MALFKLAIPPDRNGYGAMLGKTAAAVQLDGGGPRVRADLMGSVATVDVQWTTGREGFDYLNAFYRVGAGSKGVPGCLPFQIDLLGIDSSDVQTYQAWFVPETFGLKSQSGLTYVTGAQLWVIPNPPSENDDLQTIASYPV